MMMLARHSSHHHAAAAASRRPALSSPSMTAPRPVAFSSRRPSLTAARAAGDAASDRVTKADLADAVAAALPSLTKKDAALAVDAVFEAIASALARGGEASVAGFGAFKVGERAAREGRNPRTGEAIPIAASKAAKFSAGKALKDKMNGGAGGGADGAGAGAGAAKTAAAAAPAAGRKTAARAPTASAAGRKTAARRSTKSK
jgi:DNA-binding protein HU-beta